MQHDSPNPNPQNHVYVHISRYLISFSEQEADIPRAPVRLADLNIAGDMELLETNLEMGSKEGIVLGFCQVKGMKR